ncbi:Ribulose-phosphate 3-epimerase [Posidoniimonas polymericola]|uniref:Ribulose-phosphate 3-epimerase n=1 Tax=Posidoniimonas polymericola TaxID=2528002 RepID=A0A5C5YIC9_9BACT|nr:ribulose-phosphate 3-epimerase [Posidoniimonas polymericola]TWT74626.1 Ribulose-phosphate 3-epimerase [Posidoniimonas polymericola]
MPSSRSRESIAALLRQHAPVLLPSLLACDFANLASEVKAIEAAGAHALHLDVMDGHFVPNLSFGLPVVEAIRALTDLPLDVHLMIDNPAEYAQRYRDAGADCITVHAEVLDDPRPLLEEIRASGALAGLSLNPPTPLEQILPALPHCDLVLVMSVMPGFGGQQFDPVALEKLSRLRDDPDCRALLEVDGGVNQSTIARCTAAGADLLVAGTAVFGADDYCERVDSLNRLARSGRAG